MKSIIRIILVILLITNHQSLITTYAQISINETGNSPDTSAILDVASTDKGLLIPRMDSTNRNAIATPAAGLLVYDTTTISFWYYDDNQWNEIRNGSQTLTVDATGTNLTANFSNMEEVRRLSQTNLADNIAIKGNYAYLTHINSPDLKIVDISSPTAPLLVNTITFKEDIYNITISGDYAYIMGETTNRNYPIDVMDLSNPIYPPLVDSINLGSIIREMKIIDTYAYTMNSGGRLYISDISNPIAPIILGNKDFAFFPYSLDVSGNYAYIVDNLADAAVTIKEVRIIDLSDATNPVELDSIFCINPYYAVVSGNYLYVIDDDYLKSIDISNVYAPVRVDSVSVGGIGPGIEIVISGNYAFIDAYDDILTVVDISNPASLSLVGTLNLNQSIDDIEIVGNYAYIVDGKHFRIVKLTNYANATIYPSTDEFSLDTMNLDDHTALENIQLSNHYLSNDGDDEGIHIGNSGTVVFTNNILLNGNYLSNDGDNEGINIANNGKVTVSNNIILNGNYLSRDGDNEGISIDDNGKITTSHQLTTGGNITLNAHYLSNDLDDEGIQINATGDITTNQAITINGNLTVDNIYGNNDTIFSNAVLMVSDSFSIEHSTSGSEAYIATFRNTANDNSFSNHGINVIAGHDSYNSSNKSRLIKFTTPDDNSLGRIQQNATGSLAYNVTSDIRLKTNIQPTKYGLNDLLKIQVSDYFYKNDASKTPQTGFIAQQLHRIYPVAVTVGGDNEKVNPWMVDYAKLTPLLVKGIQTQQVLLDKLTMENGQLDKKQTSQQTAIESLTVQANTNHTNIQQLEQQLLILSELQKESESMKAMLKQIQGQLN